MKSFPFLLAPSLQTTDPRGERQATNRTMRCSKIECPRRVTLSRQAPIGSPFNSNDRHRQRWQCGGYVASANFFTRVSQILLRMLPASQAKSLSVLLLII
jgi:hypothetical protein